MASLRLDHGSGLDLDRGLLRAWPLVPLHRSSGVAAEIGSASVSPFAGPGVATFVFPTVKELHVALDRIYRLAMSLPEAPLDRFKAKTANLPRTTEAERWVIQRVVRTSSEQLCWTTGIAGVR
jgi:hypothetical protein